MSDLHSKFGCWSNLPVLWTALCLLGYLVALLALNFALGLGVLYVLFLLAENKAVRAASGILIGFVIAIFWNRFVVRRKSRDALIPTLKGLVIGLITGAALWLLPAIASCSLGTCAFYSLQINLWPLISSILFVAYGVLQEEIIGRHLSITLAPRMHVSVVAALCCQALVFAILHPDQRLWITAGAGLVFGLLYIWTGGIWAPSVAHGVFNLGQTLALGGNAGFMLVYPADQFRLNSGFAILVVAVVILLLIFWQGRLKELFCAPSIG